MAALTSVLSRPGAAAGRNHRCGYADFLRGVGGRTTMSVRLSTVGEGLADADVVRDPPEPAINFCTEEVSYGLAGDDALVSFIKTSINFPDQVPDFTHTPSRVRSLVTPISHRTHRPRLPPTDPDEGWPSARAGRTRTAAACAPVRW
ncbi:catalase [Streptomyces sp. NBC_01314]|uniref:catalase n=1 Tax=Streptomyces sp. NBC_01314 TaxID=2903821 RepID=UPI00352F7934